MSEMTKRVGKAIAAARERWHQENRGDSYPGESMPDELIGRAAIAAMRDPTEAMVNAPRWPDHMGVGTNEEIKQSLLELDAAISAEWEFVSSEVNRCLAEGNYYAERILRERAFERQRELIRQWQDWRITLPPFTTKEKGYYQRHPITPENRHLLIGRRQKVKKPE